MKIFNKIDIFFLILLIVSVFLSCENSNKALSNKQSTFYFYHPVFHTNPDIFVADSLAWHYQSQQAIDKFSKINLKDLNDETQRYVLSRWLYVLADHEQRDSSLFYRVYELYNESKDIYCLTALRNAQHLYKSAYNLKFNEVDSIHNVHNSLFYTAYAIIHNSTNSYETQLTTQKLKLLDRYFTKKNEYDPLYIKYFDLLATYYVQERDDDLVNIYLDAKANFEKYSPKIPVEIQESILVSSLIRYILYEDDIDNIEKGGKILNRLRTINPKRDTCGQIAQEIELFDYLYKYRMFQIQKKTSYYSNSDSIEFNKQNLFNTISSLQNKINSCQNVNLIL